MNIIVLCVFFVLFPCGYCSGEKVVSINVYEEPKDQVPYTYCNGNNKNIELTAGEVILFNITSERSINFVHCTSTESNLKSTLHLTEIQNNEPIPDSNNNHHYIYKFNTTVSGSWFCSSFTHKNSTNVHPIKSINGINYAVSKCDMIISVHDSRFCDWKCMVLVGVVLTISIIIILFMGCALIYNKRKASSLHRLESLSSKPRPANDRARYSHAPLKKPLVTIEHGDRDSVIYEVLDNLKISQAPTEAPPVDTLPHTPNANEKADTPSPSTSEVSILKENKKKNKPIEKNKKVNKKMSLPSIRVSKSEGQVKIRAFSFGKIKNKAKAKAGTKDKRSSMEKITERPPLPLPITSTSDEEYEEMSPVEPERTPVPVKHEFKIPSTKKLPTKVQNTLTKATPPLPNQTKPALKANAETVNELENILKKKGLGSGRPLVPPSRRTGTTPKPNLPPVSNPVTASTTTPRSKGALPKKFQPLPVPTKPTPPASPVKPLASTPTKPTVSKFLQSTPAVAPKPTKPLPMNAPLPPPISTLPRPSPSSQREESTRAVTSKPMKPAPMDAPVPPPISTLPRPTPAIQVEKSDEEIYDNHWEGEDWTYEPLQEYNIYSM